MVDPRDFLTMDEIDPELEARADQLQLMGGAIARRDKRGTSLKRHGHLWIDAGGRAAAKDVVVCDYGDWAMTLIADTAPPTGRKVELEWEGEGGILKRARGRVTDIRHGRRGREPFPDLFFARFEIEFL
jgi:hypothetical protein